MHASLDQVWCLHELNLDDSLMNFDEVLIVF